MAVICLSTYYVINPICYELCNSLFYFMLKTVMLSKMM